MAGLVSLLALYKETNFHVQFHALGGSNFFIFVIVQVFGGSWGSTLALAYSQAHADKVCNLHDLPFCFGLELSVLNSDAFNSVNFCQG